MAAPEFNYTESDATGLAQAIKDKVLSPREAVDEAFAAIACVNPQLNAVIREMRDAADEQLQHLTAQAPQDQGALFGVPTLLKDDCPSYAGAPMSYGCRAADGNVSERDHELVTRYRAAGLVIIGKTNLPEFSCNIATEPSLHGATLNPWDTSKSIGGSSGGAAAAVAARMVPVAYGNDGAGSIRIPAACSGLFGLRPSRGRVPCGPVSTENWGGMVSHHVLTRSVRDSALMLDLTDAPEQGALYSAPAKTGTFMQAVNQAPRKLRIGLWQKTGLETPVEQAVLEALHKTAEMCAALGHEIVEITPDYDAQALSDAFTRLVATYTAMEVDDLARDFDKPINSDFFEPSNLGLAEYGRSLSGLDILRARNQVNSTARSFGRMFSTVDVVLSPVLPCLPFDKGTLNVRSNDWKHFARQFMELTMFTHPVNAAGAPAMSVPLLQTAENTPLGMQFIAANGKEETLLTLAAQLECDYPWIAAALRFAPEDIKHMLYTKDYFQPHNDDEIFDLIDRTVLGTLITPHENGVAISHPVFMIDRQNRRLISHIAMNNDHGQYLRAGLPSVAILMDQGSYISSSWYPNYPQRDSAPTWSFMVAHIHGKPEIMSDAETAQHLQDLVTHMERGRDKPWQMKELGPGGMGRRLPNILGYTMPIDKMEVKFKLGQDERSGDMKAASEQLDKDGQQALANRMRDYCKL